MQKKILITGGAGFVGSSLAIKIKKKYPDYSIYCLDNLKRSRYELNIPRLAAHGINFVHGDIRSREDFYPFETDITTMMKHGRTISFGRNKAIRIILLIQI